MTESLTGKTPASTYKDLLQVSNGNTGIDGTLRPISDGEGTESALKISTDAARLTGPLDFTGTDHAGIRLNNLTTQQRDALQGPEKGMVIFNVTTGQPEQYSGAAWAAVGGAGFSGDYDDLENKPTLAAVATSGAYSDLSGKPTLAAVATSGAYADLSGKPTLAAVAASGSYNDLSNKPTLGSAAALAAGSANGAATLDGTGKVPVSQIPASIVDGLEFAGLWNASTNSPALASGTGTKGRIYKVSVAGATSLDGIGQWNAGDMAFFDGTTWDKIDGLASEVLSVAGRTGNVVLTPSDIVGLGTPASLNLALADYVAGARLSLAANNCRLPNNYNTSTDTWQNCWTRHRSGPAGIRNPTLGFLNGLIATNSEQDAPYDFNLTIGIYCGGEFTQASIGGQKTVLMSRAWGTAFGATDVYIPPNTDFWVTNLRVAADAATAANPITGATQANPVVITSTGHGLLNGQTVEISAVGGMTQLNYSTNGNVRYKVANATANTFELTSLLGVNIDGTGYSTYTSGGMADRCYNIITSHAGTTRRQDGIIKGKGTPPDFTLGVGVGYGAKLLPPFINGSGVITSVPIDPNNTGVNYSGGLTVVLDNGDAGAGQPASTQPGSGWSGYGVTSGGHIASVTTSSGGTTYDPNNPPAAYACGGGTAGTGFGGATAAYGPFTIFGVADGPTESVLALVDSIGSGYGSADGTGDIHGNHGIYERALANKCGVMIWGVPGDSASGWLQNSTRRMALLNALVALGLRINTAIPAFGTNDFLTNNNSNVVASTQSTIASIIALLKGTGGVDRCFTITVIPSVTGTYTSLGGQTQALVSGSNANFGAGGRVEAYNAAIRNGTGIPTQDGYIDPAVVIADPTTPSKFRVDGVFYLQASTGVAFTSDGIHPNATAGIPYIVRRMDMSKVLRLNIATAIVSAQTNSVAQAGFLDERISAKVDAANAVSLTTTATPVNITSILIGAGNWSLTANVNYVLTGATMTNAYSAISKLSAALGAANTFAKTLLSTTTLTDTFSIPSPEVYVKVPAGATATYYLVASAAFTAGTVAAYGQISATRRA